MTSRRWRLAAAASLVGIAALLCACAGPSAPGAAPPDLHIPPFAKQPYQPFSRDAAVQIAYREWRAFGQKLVASPEAKAGVWQQALERPYRGFRLSRTQGHSAGFGLKLQGQTALGGSEIGDGRPEGRSAQSGQEFAAVQPENSI